MIFGFCFLDAKPEDYIDDQVSHIFSIVTMTMMVYTVAIRFPVCQGEAVTVEEAQVDIPRNDIIPTTNPGVQEIVDVETCKVPHVNLAPSFIY